ncbi:hypothetical protein B0H34DRAFT_798079 [Crassisporium funariophilum]|nr:hypothetical protein B0H34DRAFT_798079 [Crassisporium funariophilum]
MFVAPSTTLKFPHSIRAKPYGYCATQIDLVNSGNPVVNNLCAQNFQAQGELKALQAAYDQLLDRITSLANSNTVANNVGTHGLEIWARKAPNRILLGLLPVEVKQEPDNKSNHNIKKHKQPHLVSAIKSERATKAACIALSIEAINTTATDQVIVLLAAITIKELNVVLQAAPKVVLKLTGTESPVVPQGKGVADHTPFSKVPVNSVTLGWALS